MHSILDSIWWYIIIRKYLCFIILDFEQLAEKDELLKQLQSKSKDALSVERERSQHTDVQLTQVSDEL